jgi:hypothetical protein
MPMVRIMRTFRGVATGCLMGFLLSLSLYIYVCVCVCVCVCWCGHVHDHVCLQVCIILRLAVIF